MPVLTPETNLQTPPVTIQLDMTQLYTLKIGIVNTVIQITITPVQQLNAQADAPKLVNFTQTIPTK
jgi:hypothetical protein